MARPTYVLEAGFGSSPDTSVASTVWTDITAYLDVKSGVRITRGRQDELAELQPSRMKLALNNADGRFTAGRAASPYYPNVKTGKRIRLGISYPGGGKNYSPNTCTDSGVATGWVAGGATPPTIGGSSLLSPPVGTAATLITWAAGSGTATLTIQGLVAGRTYTAQANLRVTTGSPHITLTISGASVATTAFDVWQPKTVTFTATGNQVSLVVTPNTVPAAGAVARINALQIEEGAAASTFVTTPGVFSWRFTGDVAEWPTDFAGGPAKLASTALTAYDRFRRLGDLGEFRTLLEEATIADAPVAYYPLSEAAGSTSAGDVSGNGQPPLTVTQLVGTTGVLTFGLADNSVPPFYQGKTTGVDFTPADTVTGKFLSARLPTATTGTTGAGVVAYMYQASGGLPTNGPVAFLVADDGSYFGIARAAGTVNAVFYNATTGSTYYAISGQAITNAVTQVAARLDVPSGGQGRIYFYLNGVQTGSTSGLFTLAAVPKWTGLRVGGRDKVVDGVFKGHLSHVSFYDYPIGATLVTQQDAGFYGYAAAFNTYDRLTKLAGFTGLGVPFYSSYGNVFNPRGVGPQEIEGNPLEAFKTVERTEDGTIYLAGDGALVFQLRNALFNNAALISVDAGKVNPGLRFRGDDYGLVNDVTATRPAGAQVRAINTDSVTDNGRRRLSVDTVSASDADLTSVANWKAGGMGVQRNRVTEVQLSLLNDPSLIASVLAGTDGGAFKISVTGLPSQAPSAQADLIVRGWEEVLSEDEWTITLNTSPAEVYDVWQLGVAGHSELGTTTRLAVMT